MTPRTSLSSRSARPARVALAALAALAIALVGMLAAAGPAHADTYYRYWGYYSQSGGHWQFATKGAGAVTSKDGAVEGWRYAVAGSAPRPPRADTAFAALCRGVAAESGKKRVGVVVDPGVAADAPHGSSLPSAPAGYCVVAPTSATDLAVLSAAAPVAQTKGLVCEILRYPSTGCDDKAVTGAKVPAHEAAITLGAAKVIGAAHPVTSSSTPPSSAASSAAPAASPTDTSSTAAAPAASVTTTPVAGTSTHRSVWIIVVAAVVIVLAAAALLLTRRRRSE